MMNIASNAVNEGTLNAHGAGGGTCKPLSIVEQDADKDITMLKRFLSVCCSASFFVEGSESDSFLDELKDEARTIGKKINLLGGKNMMQSIFTSLSLEEQAYIVEAWSGIGKW